VFSQRSDLVFKVGGSGCDMQVDCVPDDILGLVWSRTEQGSGPS
jgi:hypothetical protein